MGIKKPTPERGRTGLYLNPKPTHYEKTLLKKEEQNQSFKND